MTSAHTQHLIVAAVVSTVVSGLITSAGLTIAQMPEGGTPSAPPAGGGSMVGSPAPSAPDGGGTAPMMQTGSPGGMTSPTSFGGSPMDSSFGGSPTTGGSAGMTSGFGSEGQRTATPGPGFMPGGFSGESRFHMGPGSTSGQGSFHMGSSPIQGGTSFGSQGGFQQPMGRPFVGDEGPRGMPFRSDGGFQPKGMRFDHEGTGSQSGADSGDEEFQKAFKQQFQGAAAQIREKMTRDITGGMVKGFGGSSGFGPQTSAGETGTIGTSKKDFLGSEGGGTFKGMMRGEGMGGEEMRGGFQQSRRGGLEELLRPRVELEEEEEDEDALTDEEREALTAELADLEKKFAKLTKELTNGEKKLAKAPTPALKKFISKKLAKAKEKLASTQPRIAEIKFLLGLDEDEESEE